MGQMEQVKALREKTGAGIVDVKKALDEANFDEAKAIEILRKRGQDKAMKKSDRATHEGTVVSYVHSNGRIGVLVKLYCETDFVARNEEFQAFGRDIALHIAASAPQYVKPEDVSLEVVAKEQEIWRAQLAQEGKPARLIEKILLGKEEKFCQDMALLTQPFVKDPTKTVGELLVEKIHKMGENIQIGSFVRYEL
ncbi:MAG: translation elongation factor Ts [Candidatus Moranbacteria bacterium]|nr:translation elongation factor Ts [Candidatus Moranbacteria bacterium]